MVRIHDGLLYTGMDCKDYIKSLPVCCQECPHLNELLISEIKRKLNLTGEQVKELDKILKEKKG